VVIEKIKKIAESLRVKGHGDLADRLKAIAYHEELDPRRKRLFSLWNWWKLQKALLKKKFERAERAPNPESAKKDVLDWCNRHVIPTYNKLKKQVESPIGRKTPIEREVLEEMDEWVESVKAC
jgi:hypothetical protein